MKKIIGLALALAAAALVFVGCGDSTGDGDTKGNKWDTTMFVDATDANLISETKYKDGYAFRIRRYWNQLGDNDGKGSIAGITTTIRIKKEGLDTTNAAKTSKNTAVVGLMFDYNNSYVNDNENKDKKDYFVIGVNMFRNYNGCGSTKPGPQYYVVRYNGVSYKKDDYGEKLSLDTNDDDVQFVSDENITGNASSSWISFDGLYNEGKLKFKGENEAVDAYEFVVDIRPHFEKESDVIATGYEVRLGKTIADARSADPVICPVDEDRIPELDLKGDLIKGKEGRNYTSVTVGKGSTKQTYYLPCGGITVYGAAKTKYYPTDCIVNNKLVDSSKADNDGTKIVANYYTDRTGIGLGKKESFDSLEDMNTSAVIGDLKLTNTSNDNFTVIVE